MSVSEAAKGRPWLSIVAATALTLGGLAACSQPQQDEAQAEMNEAGNDAEAAVDGVNTAEVREEAAQLGTAIEAGAREVAQEIDQGTDRLAAEAEEQRAETHAEGTATN